MLGDLRPDKNARISARFRIQHVLVIRRWFVDQEFRICRHIPDDACANCRVNVYRYDECNYEYYTYLCVV